MLLLCTRGVENANLLADLLICSTLADFLLPPFYVNTFVFIDNMYNLFILPFFFALTQQLFAMKLY